MALNIPEHISTVEISRKSGVGYETVSRYRSGTNVRLSNEKKIVRAVTFLLKEHEQMVLDKEKINGITK